MSRSKDQRPSHAHALAASAAPQSPTHPARSLMEQRWEERRAAASTRRNADVSGVQPTGRPAPEPPDERLLEDMRALELKDQHIASYPPAVNVTGPLWLRDTQTAMLIVASVSCTVLLLLLYFGGFIR